jgi:hypothetical protein
MPDWDALYRERIHPTFAVPKGGVASPRCIFVTGHQGSGKTTLLHRLLAEIGPSCTQGIVPDALVAIIDEVHGESPDSKAAFDAYRKIHCATHCQLLADHAVAQRSHILWERAIPGNIERLAIALRQLGYRVEALVLATPVEESWLGAIGRCLAALDAGEARAMRIGWPLVSETALRWPVFLDRVETSLIFDRVAVLDREDEICFDNSVEGPPENRHWSATPFAFESLMVERARPRSAATLAALLADWEALLPRVTAAGHRAWPPEDCRAFDSHLRDLVADPASRFDLNAPGPDAAAAQAWIARLAADLAAVQASPEVTTQSDLAPRCQRFLQLVSQLAGQPTR